MKNLYPAQINDTECFAILFLSCFCIFNFMLWFFYFGFTFRQKGCKYSCIKSQKIKVQGGLMIYNGIYSSYLVFHNPSFIKIQNLIIHKCLDLLTSFVFTLIIYHTLKNFDYVVPKEHRQKNIGLNFMLGFSILIISGIGVLYYGLIK